MDDLKDIDKNEDGYFLEKNKKGIFMSMSIKSSLEFTGFGSSFEIKEEDVAKEDVKTTNDVNTTIKNTSLNVDNKKSLL